jgi:SAM-dependent methyltransferase
LQRAKGQEIMSGVGSAVSGFIKYFDPKRQIGSQSERPQMTIEGGTITLTGYQSYQITDRKVAKAGLGKKYSALFHYLSDNRRVFGPGASLLDIGCSGGLLCFLAREAGFARVTGLDHDPEYIEMVQRASRESGLAVNTVVGDWKDATGTYDVVCVLALIHWIYSLTGAEGSFPSVFRYLRQRTGRYLLIEWVDPTDPAIGVLKHVSANPELHREPYERARFETAGQRYFGSIDGKIDITPTRCIYIFRKERRIAGYSGVVSFGETAVVKHFHDDMITHQPEQIMRERKALAKLAGTPGIPYLLASDKGAIHMTFAGDRLTRANLPADAQEQGRALVAAMRRRGIRHNDIHRDNLLVLDSRLHLIDFAWACGIDEPVGFLPPEIGVRYGAREVDDPIDDLAMMLRSLALVRGEEER